ncbi:PrsW family intramembrane metalloprotease [Mycolicibacterium litorale]|uniref:Protease PrsW n=1 Tax=Mycolicibacterium litorale TaxID=758802 RepID=A0AAD1IIS6_9MYCO|nr:PrsW family intramembrane metalloprotease [Mycolicibacterium litorale]MCV7414147.1 PrsW family intramembrane metalloprotease [Mycolicibacterium litorale]TDY02161.1 RsiW-degrading membrane proteinase PrsW (M82 family) [Mycolicibacterium litorale]BBY15666.1 protease PrsW [Mycolicibacterium litorale]
MSRLGTPPPPQLYASPWVRQVRRVGAPLGVLIALGTLAGLLVILLTAVNPTGTAIGFVLSSIAMAVVVLAYLWLDRWEPEPPRLLVFAFLWGTSAAVVISAVLQLFLEAWVNPALGGDGSEGVSPVTLVLGAPLTEEAAKGLFLLIMMTGARRNEMNSLTDCLVYAGLVGAGFAWLEDILYIANGESLADSLLTAALRLVMAPFAHSLFTTVFAIGVWFALQRREAAARTGFLLLGYAGAVLLHAMWNGSSLLGVGAYFGLYVFWMMPMFALAILLAVRSRRREQQVVAAKLPGMVAAGVVTPSEATWLGSLRTRKQAVAEARRFGGKQAEASVKKFAHQVVELAFVRDRIDRGFGDPRVVGLLHEETYAVYAARAASPALHHMAGYRAGAVIRP